MKTCMTEFPLTRRPRDLEHRLASRRAIEAGIHAGRRSDVHSEPFLLRDHLAAPILRAALRIAGLYSRGTRNALAPIVQRIRFEFEDLPAGFDGFRILHLADLHLDGVMGLAEIVAARLACLETDLCVMTGDYRFGIEGPCDAVYPHLRTILSTVRAR